MECTVELAWLVVGGFIDAYSNIIQIAFKTKNEPLLRELINKCREIELAIDDLDCEFLTIDLGTIRLRSKDKEALSLFLNTIDTLHPLGKNIKREIFDTLELKQIPDLNSFLTELHSLVDASKFDQALQQAKSVDDNDVIFLLGNYCKSKGHLEQAIICYKEIPIDNLNYKNANELIAYTLMDMQNVNSNSQHEAVSLDESEGNLSNVNEQFTFMINAEKNQENQRWLDLIYHQLSGGEGLSPTITGIQPDAATLLLLADQTRLMRNEIASLKTRLANTDIASTYQSSLFEKSTSKNTAENESQNTANSSSSRSFSANASFSPTTADGTKEKAKNYLFLDKIAAEAKAAKEAKKAAAQNHDVKSYSSYTKK